MFRITDEIIHQYSEIKPTYKRVYLILKDAIISGGFTFDEKISEEALAKRLGISRTPLRRALNDLKNDGILEDISKETIKLKKPSRKEMSDLVNFDAVLEAYAAYLVAIHGITDEELTMLNFLNEQLRHVDERYQYTVNYEQELSGTRDVHLQFHLMLARLSNNKILYETIVSSRMKMRQYSSLTFEHETDRPSDTYRNTIATLHDGLIKAIKERDPESARAWMHAEIIRSKSAYLDCYENPFTVTR